MIFLTNLAFGEKDKAKAQENFFKMIDKNANGQITEEEFFSFWQKHFNEKDSNKNGTLTQNEYAPEITEAGYRIFVMLDTNKDGVVSWKEERALRMQHFVSYVKDKNKLISLAEMQGRAEKK